MKTAYTLSVNTICTDDTWKFSNLEEKLDEVEASLPGFTKWISCEKNEGRIISVLRQIDVPLYSDNIPKTTLYYLCKREFPNKED